ASSRVDDLFGDILMVYKENNTWKMESNGQAGSRSGTGVGNGQGPGGGEFFGDDFFPKNPSDHPEVALGSLFILPGTDEVVAAVYDPLYNTYSGGLHRYNTISGQKTGSKELYNHNFANYFGKASGFGDVTGRCGSLPVEIGNLVWIDENENGLQDAGEKTLAGVELVICDASCNEIGSTITDSNGNYAFNNSNVDKDGDGQMDGLTAGSKYYISLDPDMFDAQASAYLIDEDYYFPTIIAGDSRINSNLDGDLEPCSDPTTKNLPVVEVIAEAGNLTSFDLGLKASSTFDLALMKIKDSNNSAKIGQTVTFEIEVFNQGGLVATEYEIVDYITKAFRFDAAYNPGWTFSDGIARRVVKSHLLPGSSHKESIMLTVLPTKDISDFVNIAEISYAKDITGALATDSDSTPDDKMDNDKGGEVNTNTDDELSNDGTIDEDDHDPAFLEVMDLALMNIVRDDRNYDIGEKVIFDMTVYNQGNVPAKNIEVTNQYPESLTFNQSENSQWTQSSGSTVSTTINEVLEPGASITVSVTLDVIDNNGFRNIVDYAEISGFMSDNPSVTVDFDSSPDILFNNDIGGNPYDYTDNMIDDHGSVDEDDHDPAFVRVRLIDLALKKSTESEAQEPGDVVSFDIDVINQGEISVRTVTLVDYLPDHTTLVDNSWTTDTSDPTGRIVYKVLDFPEGFKPGTIHTETISLSLDMNVDPGLVINEAEIAQVTDFNGMDISELDIDSKADMKKENDAGGIVFSDKDDFLDGNGIDDEDDHDPAALYVAMIDVVDNCICMNNASNSADGQFTEIIEVTAPTGQTWKVDHAVGIYDPSSVSPPVAPTPFATGDSGYTLVETPLFNGNSKYRLTGIIIDNTPYSLRVFNEDAAFLQISGGGSACSYEDIVIVSPTEGLSGVCTGSTHIYNVQNTYGCNDFSWSVSGGGIINGPSNQSSVEVTWTNIGGPYTLSLVPNCTNSCLSPINTQVSVGLGDGAMACRHNINVSLGLNCTTEIEADMVLTNPAGSGVVYQVMVLDDHNQLIPNNLLTEEHLWTDVTVKVINPCNGNSCWAVAAVEDKMPPSIQCEDIDMPCWQMDSYEPLVVDNCTDASYTLLSETIQPISCDVDYIKEVVRVYVAEDEFGNQSEECEQTIKLERIDLDQIDWPSNFMLLDNTNLSCMDDMYDETGFPRLEITGVPYLHGGALYPLPDFYCNIGIDYSDFLVTEFGCVKKIMRTWTVYEAWCTVGESRQFAQTIEIVDTFDPVVSCPPSMTVSSDGGTTCSATVTLDLPTVTDDCSTEFEIDISYPTGFLDNVTQAKQAVFDVGVSEVTYTVYDGCDNSGTCVTYVTVVDEAPPTAVCDQNTIVSLRSDGTAKAFAQTFDDGSFDDCSLFKMLVRRMNSNCNCHVPVYDNMRYLGERNGRYYYLSKFKTHGFKAYDYSQAFGGFLATLESNEEHEWLYAQASQYTSGNYYIGLSDEGHEGTFTWANHAQPTYNNWMYGSPNNIGDNVVTNANGYWEVVNGNATEAYFVMEVSDACTFSNEVHFCCEDVSENQLVIFRVVDYFGRYNDCMVNVEVQDKVAPDINCPADMTIDCTTAYDLNDLSAYGTATATDVCGVTLSESATDTINICNVGEINRVFTASDLNGSSTCEQTIYVENSHPFNPATIIWPADFDSDMGCGAGDLHPDNLPAVNSYPILITDQCDMVAPSYTDQTYSFAGTGANACLKILRTWTV
ncbi:MAG: DUF11 domain-containing protein, partial [Bacteroidia bacterium]|nr:DUF11 domain-containing protein [Bacteroidia bacterium]